MHRELANVRAVAEKRERPNPRRRTRGASVVDSTHLKHTRLVPDPYLVRLGVGVRPGGGAGRQEKGENERVSHPGRIPEPGWASTSSRAFASEPTSLEVVLLDAQPRLTSSSRRASSSERRELIACRCATCAGEPLENTTASERLLVRKCGAVISLEKASTLSSSSEFSHRLRSFLCPLPFRHASRTNIFQNDFGGPHFGGAGARYPTSALIDSCERLLPCEPGFLQHIVQAVVTARHFSNPIGYDCSGLSRHA